MFNFQRFAYIYSLGRHLGFTYVEITEFEADGYAQTTGAMLQRPFCYRRSFMYTAVSDISYIAESVVLGEGKRLGGVNMGLKYPVSMR